MRVPAIGQGVSALRPPWSAGWAGLTGGSGAVCAPNADRFTTQNRPITGEPSRALEWGGWCGADAPSAPGPSGASRSGPARFGLHRVPEHAMELPRTMPSGSAASPSSSARSPASPPSAGRAMGSRRAGGSSRRRTQLSLGSVSRGDSSRQGHPRRCARCLGPDRLSGAGPPHAASRVGSAGQHDACQRTVMQSDDGAK
jgi:hypothetical protein